MNLVKDPNYDRFVAPRDERYKSYKQRNEELKRKKILEKEQYRKNIANLKAQEESKIKEGMSKKQAHDYMRPSFINAKERYNGKLFEIRQEEKENRMIIFPFRLFYKPFVYNDNYLLRPYGKSIVIGIILIALFIFSLIMSEPNNFQFKIEQLGKIFSQMFGPQGGMSSIHTWGEWWAYMANKAIPLIWRTFEMMFVATSIGCLLAIPFMILCSSNIIKNKAVTGIFHVLLNIVRTFPTVVLAVIGVAMFGISNLAGIFAMIVFTMGIMIKIMFEFIETVDMHPYEASISTGASKPQAFLVAIVPQIIPAFLSNALYTFEINIRASVILGFVGAGGIGLEISNSMGEYKYNQVGAILVPLFILVLVLQIISNEVKKRTM